MSHQFAQKEKERIEFFAENSTEWGVTFTLIPGENLPSCFYNRFQNLKSIVLQHARTGQH